MSWEYVGKSPITKNARPDIKRKKRDIWIPPTVASLLWQLKKEQDEIKDLLADEYLDFEMVIAQNNGRPIEVRLIDKEFEKLIITNELPKVVFHSLRHLSTSLKLIYTNGDIKGVQGDNGHAQATMTLDVYGHILDGKRKKNAQVFEDNFYGKSSENNTKEESIKILLKKCIKEPELLNKLIDILADYDKKDC